MHDVQYLRGDGGAADLAREAAESDGPAVGQGHDATTPQSRITHVDRTARERTARLTRTVRPSAGTAPQVANMQTNKRRSVEGAGIRLARPCVSKQADYSTGARPVMP